MVTAEDGLKPHLHNATQLINRSLSRNTLKAYHTAWNAYCRFLASCPRAGTGDIRHVLAFILYCHTQLALSHNTIQHFLSLQVPGKPSLFPARTIKSILCGIQKHQPVANCKHVPITGAIFRDMSTILSRSTLGFLPSLVIQAAIYLAFYGFLRPSELTFSGPSGQILCRHYLAHFQDHFVLHLVVSKKQQTSPGVDIQLFQTNNLWCPVVILDRLLSHLPSQSNSIPFSDQSPECQPVHQAR